MIAALSICTYAADGGIFRVYNPTIVTANPNAAYIQAEVTRASGQKIIVKGTDGVVAEKQLPNSGSYCKFRIKIPAYAVRDEGITSFAVTALTAKGDEFNTTFARVRIIDRKEQTIEVSDTEYDVRLPGDTVKINASASSEKPLTYSSSDESVVKVDDEGNIEPVSGGTAEITVSQTNDSEYADTSETVKVSVQEVPYYTVRFHLGKDAPEEESDEADEAEENSDSAEETASAGSEEAAANDNQADSEDEDGGAPGYVDEETGDRIVEQKIAIGEATPLMTAADAKGDYEFLGWATSSTGYPSYDNSEEVTDLGEEKETVDLYAVWHGERAQEAIEWATMIAADNSFTYGHGSFNCCICKHLGIKKYTCMPFLAAAYAHGPQDPIMMNGGRHVMNLHDGNFKGSLGQIWEKVGLCKNLTIDDLEPGDVIIKWSAGNNSGHAWMYGGDDKIIEAVPSDIHVINGAAAKLKRYGSSEGTPSKNYVMRYKY